MEVKRIKLSDDTKIGILTILIGIPLTILLVSIFPQGFKGL